MKKRNEKTPERVARIASRILNAKTIHHLEILTYADKWEYIPPASLRILATSCLTQAPDKKKAERKTK
tara:strand:- start:481 stop:684 length:204 start_codon:yes stop_codon:yes gene_type:complete